MARTKGSTNKSTTKKSTTKKTATNKVEIFKEHNSLLSSMLSNTFTKGFLFPKRYIYKAKIEDTYQVTRDSKGNFKTKDYMGLSIEINKKIIEYGFLGYRKLFLK